MSSKSLAVYLLETGKTDRTDRVDILTPRDSEGNELVVSVDAESVTISKLEDCSETEVLQIILSDLP